MSTRNRLAESQPPTALLVEDREDLRSELAQLLNSDFRVIQAGSPKQAFRVIDELREKIDLLITDFDLASNEGDGFDVAQALRELSPYTPVVLVTGTQRDHPRVREFLHLPFVQLVEKPFVTQIILKKAIATATSLARRKEQPVDENT